jgi:hypothetical protein
LVDRLIGQLPGFASTGEMNDIVRAGIRQNRLCGCGQPFLECPFWTSVGATAFGGWDRVDAGALAAEAHTSYVGTVGRLMAGSLRAPHPARALLGRLYSSVSETAHGATIVDSSKAPNYAALLGGMPGFEVKVLHLVRDSRGVAYSWTKRLRRPDVLQRDVEMARMRAGEAAVRWVVKNATMELLTRRLPVARLRYEDLLASPRAALSEALSCLGFSVESSALGFIDERSVRLGADHTVMGNPMRMQTGDVELRLDDAWRQGLPTASRALVTALTWPFLLRYGYPLR